MYLVGVLVTIHLGITGFIGKGVVANDRDSRQRDTVQDTRHFEAVEKQQDQNTAILILLAELKKDTEHIKTNGTN